LNLHRQIALPSWFRQRVWGEELLAAGGALNLHAPHVS